MPAIIEPGSVLLTKEVNIFDATSANAWPPTITTYLDGWQLRHSSGVYNRRINFVLFVLLLSGVPIGDLSDNKNAVERFYWDRDLPSRSMVSLASMPEGIDQKIIEKGYLIDAPMLAACSFETRVATMWSH